jgi:protein involved in polysaccharide export with SLBB domain
LPDVLNVQRAAAGASLDDLAAGSLQPTSLTAQMRGVPGKTEEIEQTGMEALRMREQELALADRSEFPPAARAPFAGTESNRDLRASRPRPEGAYDDGQERLRRKPNPYADIPSLYDMYQQLPFAQAELKRFGSDVFEGSYAGADSLPMDLPVGPDYVVGPGDSLAVDLWGGVSRRIFRTVDQEGRIGLPEVGPMLVSGKTLGEVQRTVQQILRTQFRDVSADVSLARLRTVRVYVVGDATWPGAYDVSSLSTPLNALFEAGGPTERGSLRLLRHYRGKQLVQEVDVYDLLLRGVRSDVKRLENGDTVLVPPLKSQVKVEGMVRRPAAYELRGEKTLTEVLELAGGILPTATLRNIQVQRLEAHEKRTMLSVDLPEGAEGSGVPASLESFPVRDGDEIRVFPIAPHNQDAVYLQGHVIRPGRYSYREGMRVTDLVSSYKDLLPEPAVKYAEIVRLNAPDFHPSVESFDLRAVLEKPESAPELKPLDTLRIFSRFDFENPPIVAVGGEVRRPGTYRTAGVAHLRDAIQMAGGTTPDTQMDTAQVFRYENNSKLRILSVSLAEALAGDPLHNILLQPRDRIVLHRNPAKTDPPSVSIRGEVAKPGKYPLTTNMRVGDLIRLAGGLKRSAYTESADLVRFLFPDGQKQVGEQREINIAQALAGDPADDVPLHDGDALAIRQLPGWNDIGAGVVVRGEVQHPGTYGIRPGEKLSSVLKRAGGFLESGYTQAAVLERGDVRELQERGRQDLIRRLEQESTMVKVSLQESASEQAQLQQAALLQRQRALESLRNSPVTGRLVINLHKNLATFENSKDDIELRAGDALFIPKRPEFIAVTGQVYNANAITYQARKNVGWYLRRAGGVTNLADKKAIFVIRANGAVLSDGGGGWWGGGVLSARVEPGDVIVVPEKPIGQSSFWKNFLAVAQLASAASISAAVLRR